MTALAWSLKFPSAVLRNAWVSLVPYTTIQVCPPWSSCTTCNLSCDFLLWGMSMDCRALCCVCTIRGPFDVHFLHFISKSCLRLWHIPAQVCWPSDHSALSWQLVWGCGTQSCVTAYDEAFLEVCRLEEAISCCSQTTWDSEEFTTCTFLT